MRFCKIVVISPLGILPTFVLYFLIIYPFLISSPLRDESNSPSLDDENSYLYFF